ncbi:hypothetical protein E3O45_15105 [Cryobacterium sp. TMS1-20-1]|uniref:hypothetical protein n=1 Tax=Cryobacterium sp. TMS1-20-1 TaxID=1259223 RepID=UPI0010692B14|nr:hypothetical protein [Cryobacterium sp. TMS1-20-1]TFC71399.1 hypothetical protein E3O45_15105 [Cryobacterium sp. TMS1-20-1]
MSCFTVGLDLGQGADFSALVVVERVLTLPPSVSIGQYYRRPEVFEPAMAEALHVRHLRRWELGTPYPSIVSDVSTLMRSPAMRDGILFIDATGVGRAVMDMFRDEYRRADFGCNVPIAVTITGGLQRNGWNVPKNDLMASILVPLQQGNLKVAEGQALGPMLEHEFTSFRQKITASGRDTYEYHRNPGDGHGDLVSALSLATFTSNTLRRPDVVENAETLGKGN